MNFFRTVLVLLILSLPLFAAPTTLGSNGLITTPSAFLYENGEVIIGYKYSGSQFDHFSAEKNSFDYDREGVIGGFSFLPFLELSLVYHLEPFQDRLANIRVQVLKEKRYVPAVTIGFRDALTVLRGVNNTEGLGKAQTSYYNSIYLVTGKTFTYSLGAVPQRVVVHLGGGYSDFENSKYQHLHGVFGGVEYTPHVKVPVTLVGEYDTKSFYFGLTGTVVNHFWYSIGTREFEDVNLSGGIRFSLLRKPSFRPAESP